MRIYAEGTRARLYIPLGTLDFSNIFESEANFCIIFFRLCIGGRFNLADGLMCD